MEGFFDDAGWAVLGHESADESEANKYEGRLYWKYHDVLEDGSLGTEKEEEEYFDFLSYTYSCDSHSAGEENQVISDVSHISDCITRKFVVKPNEKAVVTKAYQRYLRILLRWDGTTYHTNMVQTSTKIDMEHYEKIYE